MTSNKENPKRKIISLIVPCYEEQENTADLYKEITKVWQKLKDYDYELIFVDDGSRDSTILEVEKLKQKDENVKIIELSKNFGKEIAITAGINHCLGDACLVVDADLQYPVERIPDFVLEWEKGFDIVVGVRDKKQTSNLVEVIGSKGFYMIMSAISETEVIPGALDFRLIDRKVIDEFNRFTERNRMYRALIDWVGFKKSYITYQEKNRNKGSSSYSFVKRLKLAIYSFISHSLLPLKLAGYLGLIMMIITSGMGIFALFNQFFFNELIPIRFSGPFLLGILNSFLIGVVLSCLGIISLYIANIHREVMNRPMYVVRDVR